MDIVKLYGGFEIEMECPPPAMAIEELPPPKTVILPLSDRSGSSCRPLVEKGEVVCRGERLAEDRTHAQPPIHAPVSGKVEDIREVRYPEGGIIPSLVIASDGQEKWRADLLPVADYDARAPKELALGMRDAGVRIVPFEALPDLEQAEGDIRPFQHLVINGIGTGFAGTIARQLLVERAGDLLEGVNLVKKVFQPEKIHLVLDKSHDDALQAISESGLGGAVETHKLDAYYPLGYPHLLFKELFDREIPSPHARPIDLGVAFAGVDTVLQALEAVKEGKPVTERYVTVSGEGVQSPKNLKVRIGTSVGEVIEYCGGFKGRPGRIVLGNPLDGMAQFSLEAPILKETRWIWVQPAQSVVTEPYRACIGCGDCVDICPVRIMPNFLGKFCEFGRYEEAASQYDLYVCIECGLCTYVCPSRRPMLHFIKHGKWELAIKEKEDATK